jgi:hypothetical protein
MISSIGCTNYKNKQAADEPSNVLSPFNVNRYPLNKVVCDPMGGGTPVAYDQGLHAQLYYIKSGDPIQHDVESTITQGVKSTQDLFFSQLFVPTRLFSLGFPTETGSVVQTDDGQNLIEYFALRFKGGLRLADTDAEGTYEFALLSDDGAIWSTQVGDNGYTTLVSNDGDHPTQMGCGGTLNMTHDSQFTMQLDYYQGPRYHIALIPMWRKVDGARQSEPLCGKNGNEMYFDYNNNSKPQPNYLALLARGWKPLTADNFKILQSDGFNPCATGTTPQISNVTIFVDHEGDMRVTWTTDIESTSQVLYTDLSTGIEQMSVSSNTMTTSHAVVINGLSVGHTYSVQAVSISADLGKAVSPAQQVTE